MTTNTIMTATVYRRFGAPGVVRIEQVRTPRPKAGDVLVKVHAARFGVKWLVNFSGASAG